MRILKRNLKFQMMSKLWDDCSLYDEVNPSLVLGFSILHPYKKNYTLYSNYDKLERV